MENTKVSYIKTDDNRIINENCIRWVKKMDDCLEVCALQTGCTLRYNTMSVCKIYNIESYNKLNKHFE
jgi:hypothetical protein